MFRPIALMSLLLSAAASLLAAEPIPREPTDYELARYGGWGCSLALVKRMVGTDPAVTPGICAWLDDFRQVSAPINFQELPEMWPHFDVDQLVSENPNFWRAWSEIVPGDPALLMLHSSLLMAAGELERAVYVAEIARWRTRDPRAQAACSELASNATRGTQTALALVRDGVSLHDSGDFAGALEKYNAALAVWPECGTAHYERSFTEMIRITKESAPTDQQWDTIFRGSSVARRHDPLNSMAYQGRLADSDTFYRWLAIRDALRNRVSPLYNQMRRQELPSHESLEEFSAACNQAQLHELNVVVRQVIGGRRGVYVPADLPLIASALRELAPGDITENVLKQLASGEPRPLLKLSPILQPDPTAANSVATTDAPQDSPPQ